MGVRGRGEGSGNTHAAVDLIDPIEHVFEAAHKARVPSEVNRYTSHCLCRRRVSTAPRRNGSSAPSRERVPSGIHDDRNPGVSGHRPEHLDLPLHRARGIHDRIFVEFDHLREQGYPASVPFPCDDARISVRQASDDDRDVQERLVIHQHENARSRKESSGSARTYPLRRRGSDRSACAAIHRCQPPNTPSFRAGTTHTNGTMTNL